MKRWRLALLSLGPNLYSTRRLMHAARMRGVEIDLVNYLKCRLFVAPSHPEVKINDRSLLNYHAVIPRIGVSHTYYGEVLLRQFEMIDGISTMSADGLRRSRDKLVCQQELCQAGIGAPPTLFAHSTDNLLEAIDLVGGLPVVVKILKGTHGLGVMKVDTYETAEAMIESFKSINCQVIVQEFIEESAGRDIRVFVVGGRIVAAMERRATSDDFRANIHQGGVGCTIELTQQEIGVAQRVSQVFGLDVVGVDMLRSESGPLVIDVNPSPGLQGIEQATGVDVAGEVIDFVIKKCSDKFSNL